MLSAPGPPRLASLTRRRFIGGVLGGVAVVGLGACGDDDSAEGASPGGSSSGSGTPSRVVALGQGADADALIALGLVPVAMTVPLASAGILPWTRSALGGDEVEVIDTEAGLPIEQIAAYEPELIVATTYYNLDEDRALLEEIATVLGPEASADSEAWQDTTTRVGEAVGLADEARRLVTSAEEHVSGVRDEHSEWAGRTFTFGPVLTDGQVYTINAADDASAALLEQLGLALSPTVVALPESDTPGRAVLSTERLDALDADVVLLTYFSETRRTAFEANPLFQQIPAVQAGAYVPVDAEIALGLAFPSVLSIPYVVEQITPLLATALEAR